MSNDTKATLIGYIIAITTAWATIDFSTFDIKRDWFKLVISGIIAIGGHLTVVKDKNNS